MIIHDMEQGSPEWVQARLGMPTASRFHEIMTERTCKASASAGKYMAELLTEWLTGFPQEAESNEWMQRGQQLEPQARDWYSFERDVDVATVGFVTTDDGMVGCSPDGLVGEGGGLEIKCFEAVHHIRVLTATTPLDAVAAKMTQVQGGLWITEREWWDVVAWNPHLPPCTVRVYRDEEYIRALSGHVTRFVADMVEAREKLQRMGREGRTEILQGGVR